MTKVFKQNSKRRENVASNKKERVEHLFNNSLQMKKTLDVVELFRHILDVTHG